MKKLCSLALVGAAITLGGCGVSSDPQCTTQAKDTWMDENEFQNQLKNEGYTIDKFEVTDGQCYEIYGKDANGKNVEIYFNPVNGEVVKEEND
ncbi:PepSY domain-containing protein [Salinimonas sp. HHU 13199]|uniref:PepSY domain-containing protein n=1 Tax=Salinimonas profundi TaxID=2729140 RepID=A0ABR8LMB9_9ALTE|nr:PepSY domain-containing protein [Salinimonas profundi]MBD3586468.1 PepSY domain-containing protein [Salinimonas profundi]